MARDITTMACFQPPIDQDFALSSNQLTALQGQMESFRIKWLPACTAPHFRCPLLSFSNFFIDGISVFGYQPFQQYMPLRHLIGLQKGKNVASTGKTG